MSYVARRLTTEQVWIARLLQVTCRDGRTGKGPAVPPRLERSSGWPATALLGQAAKTPVGRSRGVERGGPSEEGRAEARRGEHRVRQLVGSDL
jgi:hypothetical protein